MVTVGRGPLATVPTLGPGGNGSPCSSCGESQEYQARLVTAAAITARGSSVTATSTSNTRQRSSGCGTLVTYMIIVIVMHTM